MGEAEPEEGFEAAVLRNAAANNHPGGTVGPCPELLAGQHFIVRLQRSAAPQGDVAGLSLPDQPMVADFLAVERIRRPVGVGEWNRVQAKGVGPCAGRPRISGRLAVGRGLGSVGYVKDRLKNPLSLAEARHDPVAIPVAGTGRAVVETAARMVDEDMAIRPERRLPEVLLITGSARLEVRGGSGNRSRSDNQRREQIIWSFVDDNFRAPLAVGFGNRCLDQVIKIRQRPVSRRTRGENKPVSGRGFRTRIPHEIQKIRRRFGSGIGQERLGPRLFRIEDVAIDASLRAHHDAGERVGRQIRVNAVDECRSPPRHFRVPAEIHHVEQRPDRDRKIGAAVEFLESARLDPVQPLPAAGGPQRGLLGTRPVGVLENICGE